MLTSQGHAPKTYNIYILNRHTHTPISKTVTGYLYLFCVGGASSFLSFDKLSLSQLSHFGAIFHAVLHKCKSYAAENKPRWQKSSFQHNSVKFESKAALISINQQSYAGTCHQVCTVCISDIHDLTYCIELFAFTASTLMAIKKLLCAKKLLRESDEIVAD